MGIIARFTERQRSIEICIRFPLDIFQLKAFQAQVGFYPNGLVIQQASRDGDVTTYRQSTANRDDRFSRDPPMNLAFDACMQGRFTMRCAIHFCLRLEVKNENDIKWETRCDMMWLQPSTNGRLWHHGPPGTVNLWNESLNISTECIYFIILL